MTRILAFSDLHLSRPHAAVLREAAREADLVIGAGDFCNGRHGLEEAMELLWPFEDRAVYVPGNAESADELSAATGAVVLHGRGVERCGLRLFGLGYGVPLTPFGAWSCDLTEEEAARLLERCEAADIVVTHSPPKGVADRISGGRSVGSTAIRATLERVQPALALCGHIHDSQGASGLIGATRVYNLGPVPNWFELR